MKGNSKNIAKKTLNIILDILIVMLGIILIITIYNNIQIKILGNDYASFFGYSVFEVQTGSMEPEISAGDWIIVKYKKNIELNDIVTFEYKDEFITHSVIEKYNATHDPIILEKIAEIEKILSEAEKNKGNHYDKGQQSENFDENPEDSSGTRDDDNDDAR